MRNIFYNLAICVIIDVGLVERGGFMQRVTNLRELEAAISLNGEMVVTKNSRNNVILMSIEEYKKELEKDEIERKLLKAEKQIEEGKTEKATLVFKELEEKYEF